MTKTISKGMLLHDPVTKAPRIFNVLERHILAGAAKRVGQKHGRLTHAVKLEQIALRIKEKRNGKAV